MMKNLGIYIHIPFCLSKCHYCDFVSFPHQEALFPSYTQALLTEISLSDTFIHSPKDYIVNSIFFGGGTPSYLPKPLLRDIMQSLADHFTISPTAEITLETNPETIHDLSDFREYQAMGIHRLSLGVQSFDNAILESMNRPHRKEKIPEVITWARQSGFHNINLDLIYGYPGQALPSWKNTLQDAVHLRPEHLSVYGLTIEEGTALYQMTEDELLSPTPEEDMLEQYEYLCNFLASQGYHQYEISNFALPGYECRHNLNYWHYGDYLGLGLNAHSFINGTRSWNTDELTEYLSRLNHQLSPCSGDECLEGHSKMAEFVMLQLRLISGLSIQTFIDRFHSDPREVFHSVWAEYQPRGFIDITPDSIRLTRAGISLSDSVFADLFGDET